MSLFKTTECPLCGGSGKVQGESPSMGNGVRSAVMVLEECPQCRGYGTIVERLNI